MNTMTEPKPDSVENSPDPREMKEPITIGNDSYWVGNREGALLERNIFLRVFRGNEQTVNLIVDPGIPSDLPGLTEKISKVIGGLENINIVFINHQDPDGTYNLSRLQKINPSLTVLCSEDTWNKIKFYDLNPQRYRAVESFENLKVKLATDHGLCFIPTPFCHYRGAVMLYDRETRILYTGDLFGGLSHEKDFYADKRHWEGIKTFHQIYMPTQEAVKLAVSRIRTLDPPPQMLAPQHGSVITGEWVDYYLERLESLPVGINLLANSSQKENYIAAMNQLLLELSRVLGPEKIVSAMHAFQGDGSFAHMIQIDSSRGIIDITADPKAAIDIFLSSIRGQAAEKVNLVDVVALKVFCGRNIPLPKNLIKGGSSKSLL